jgi:hypothetical protein
MASLTLAEILIIVIILAIIGGFCYLLLRGRGR